MSSNNKKWMTACVWLAGLGLAGLVPQALAEEFDEADIFFELNDTDGDLGIHALIDGDPWKKLIVKDPNGRKLLNIKVKKGLRKQGMTELFFESAEPTFDELAPADFFARFPAGDYLMKARTLEGDVLLSTDELSHVMPAPPGSVEVNGEAAAEDCDAELPSVMPPVTIAWAPVTSSHPELGAEGDVVVTYYQLVVEIEDTDQVLSVNLPPDVTEFEIPAGFTDLAEEFKFEILVREEAGNKTAIESCFELDGGG